jgi:hypothetical protein
VVEVVTEVRLRLPVESVVVVGSYCIFTVMLWPAWSVAGSEFVLTANALSELVIAEICTGESPEFVTETFVEAVVPTFTSPKSTVDGAITTEEFDDGDEKAFESDPQPDKAKVANMDISARKYARERSRR